MKLKFFIAAISLSVFATHALAMEEKPSLLREDITHCLFEQFKTTNPSACTAYHKEYAAIAALDREQVVLRICDAASKKDLLYALFFVRDSYRYRIIYSPNFDDNDSDDNNCTNRARTAISMFLQSSANKICFLQTLVYWNRLHVINYCGTQGEEMDPYNYVQSQALAALYDSALKAKEEFVFDKTKI